MRISNPDRSPAGINRSDAAPTKTGFAEIISTKCLPSSGSLPHGRLTTRPYDEIIERLKPVSVPAFGAYAFA